MTAAARIAFVLSGFLLVGFGQACGRRSTESEPPKSPAPTKEAQLPSDRPARAIKNFLANPTDSKGQRLMVRGDNAVSLSREILSITNILIQTERDGSPDMIIQAAHCIYNTTNFTFFSDGELLVRTADQRLSMQGRGFLFLQRESRLVVSNDVKTAVRWRSFSGRNSLAKPTEPALPRDRSDTDPAAPDAEMVEIRSERLDYRPELALFERNVQARETNGLLRCERLAAHFVSNRVERVEVDQNVFIEQGSARATGDRGTFTAAQEKGIAYLIGHATWRDAQHEIAADTLVLDRVRNSVRCEGKARLKLPRQTLSLPGAWLTLSAGGPNRPTDTNAFLELSSDLLTLQLPPTNGPIQRIQAERNVVVVSPTDNSRATGGLLVYDESSGTLELTGEPILTGKDYLVKGETLILDRTNRAFHARRNAYVRIPAAALGKSSLLARDPAVEKGTGAATNQFLEAYSDEFHHRTNQMEFQHNVHVNLSEGDFKQGELLCADLKIRFGQRLESLLASGGVVARQFPSTEPGAKRVSKELSCETLKVTMNSEGRLDKVLAEQSVKAQQTATGTNRAKPRLTKLAAARLEAHFAPQTNQVQAIFAERNVRIEQDGRTAQGDHAVFRGTNQILELTGQPTALAPEGRITEAEVLIWDAVKQQMRVRGPFKSEWQRLRVGDTNNPTLPAVKSPKP